MNVKVVIGSLVVGLVGTICLPILQQAITDGNFSGTVGTIMDNVPVFYALALLVGVIGGIYYGVTK